jgi:beta-galactosidase
LGIEDESETAYPLRAPDLGGDYTAVKQADWITPRGAETLATYDEPHLKDFAAATRHEYEDGVGWYVGTIVQEDAFYDALMAKVLDDAEIESVIDPPDGVEACLRSGDGRKLLFLVNYTEEERTVDVPEGKLELLTDERTDAELKLDAFGVAVIELEGGAGEGE